MALDFDLDLIVKEYSDDGDAFGFSAVSEAEYNQVINDTAETADAYKARLDEVEKLIMPFLTKLLKTSDKEYIYWPNRKAALEQQINKILKLTRS